jgi:hypothetical protein
MKSWRVFCSVLIFGVSGVYGQLEGLGLGQQQVLIHAPPPVRLGQELRLNAFRMEAKPPEFFLNYGTRGRLGPYPLVNGTKIGDEKSPYILHVTEEGLEFKLEAKQSEKMYGPFSTSNLTAFAIGSTPMMFLRVPPKVSITMNHPTRIGQTPTIGIAPLNDRSVKALYDLRTKTAGIVNRVNEDKSDRELVGVPRVYNSFTGNTFKPIVSISDRDKQNADRSGEVSTVAFLEKFFSQYCTIRSQAITDKLTFHLGLQVPGDYLVLVMQKVKPPASAPQGSASPMAIWWTTFSFDGHSSFSGTLTPENAATWKNAFLFE